MPTIPKPLTSTASKPEFEVVWNGVHHDCDADLLTPIGAPIEKHLAVPKPPKRMDVVDQVEAALPVRDRDGLSLAEIAAKTALTKATVNAALYSLRQRGRLQSAPLYDGRGHRAPQRYWRPIEPAIRNDAILVGGVEDWLRRE